ncbi:UNVERIFIED_CONTAM: putative mitochondrial protein [Sesamum angustifolium]|uniref:Mitochondrial protein n=1 Tax=Sesamum angustifolium TaxID=2727405 RepID=A0AAW2MCJ1_9LAMI
MMIPASHFSQLTTLPTNPLKPHRRPTSPADKTRLQYLVQVSIGSSMPNLEVLDLECSRPTLRSWFQAAKLMRNPTPWVNLSIRGHFVVILKPRSISVVMSKLGFPSLFICLIMKCVSFVSYCFMLGGKIIGSLIPQRGLRQGDPLSRYLFLVCIEAFSSLLHHAECFGRICGVSVCRGAPSISHLFADDTLIFCQASLESVANIKAVLEDCLGPRDWKSIFLSRRLHSVIILQRVARSKRELFRVIRDRIWTKITKWHEKLLSQAGGGGLGFRQLQLFNLAMLAKQLWRILKQLETLLSWVLKAKYFPTRGIFSVSLGRHPSFTWSSVMAAHNLLQKLVSCRAIGSSWWGVRFKEGLGIIPAPGYAYHLVCELEDRSGSSSLGLQDHWWWRKVWQASFPNKSGVGLISLHLDNHDGKDLRPVSGRKRCPLTLEIETLVYFCAFVGRLGGAETINFDGATFRGGVELGVGVVARNGLARCVAWFSRRLRMAGTGALAKAVLFALQRGWQSVIFEGDCGTLVYKLRTREQDLSVDGPVITDILNYASNFNSCEFTFVRRPSNSVAHFFAHYYDLISCDSAKRDNVIPPCVALFVTSDLMS